MSILDYAKEALDYANKYKDVLKLAGSAGKAYLDYKNQKELNELSEEAYNKYMQEKQAAGQEAQAAVDINLTPMEVTGLPRSKADVTDFTALAAKGGIIGLKNGGDPNAGITALRKKAPSVVKRMGFEKGSPDSVGFEMYGGEDLSFPRKENESQEMAILNGLFNDVEGKVDEETKMKYYKILIPAVYKNGEISKEEYDAMIEEIIVNKAKGGIANLRKGGRPSYRMGKGPVMDETVKLIVGVKEDNNTDGTVKIEDAVSETENMRMANFTFSKRILDEYNANVAEGYDGSIEDYIIEFYGEEYLDPTYAKGGIANLKNGGFPDLNKDGKVTKADVLKGRGVFNMGGGVMDLGGMEKDYRFNGGFVPIGEYEKKDDVPARLSKNEFVFTADAVRAAGGGSINKGAKRMYETMKNLEAQPTAKRMTA